MIINLFYRGGSSNYLSRESANNSPIETVTSIVELVIFQRGVMGGLISFPSKFGSMHVQLSSI